MNPKSMAPMNSGSFRLQMSEFGPSSSAVAPILARYARKVGSADPASVRVLASASNLRSQFITHLLKLRSTASRLLSHHSALYLTPTSRCAVGSSGVTRGSTLGIDSLFIGAYGMKSESR